MTNALVRVQVLFGASCDADTADPLSSSRRDTGSATTPSQEAARRSQPPQKKISPPQKRCNNTPTRSQCVAGAICSGCLRGGGRMMRSAVFPAIGTHGSAPESRGDVCSDRVSGSAAQMKCPVLSRFVCPLHTRSAREVLRHRRQRTRVPGRCPCRRKCPGLSRLFAPIHTRSAREVSGTHGWEPRVPGCLVLLRCSLCCFHAHSSRPTQREETKFLPQSNAYLPAYLPAYLLYLLTYLPTLRCSCRSRLGRQKKISKGLLLWVREGRKEGKGRKND